MINECKIITFDLNTESKSSIQHEIERYCNETFFTYKSIKTCTATQLNNEYTVNIIYEYKFKWLKFLMFLLIIGFILAIFFYLIKI